MFKPGLWWLRGAVEMSSSTLNDDAIEAVARKAIAAGARIVEQSERSLGFENDLFGSMTGNWHLLLMADRGWVSITKSVEGRQILNYSLRMKQGFLFCVFGAIFLATFAGAFEGPQYGLKIGLLTFGWLWGVSYLVAIIRIPRFFARVAQR